MKELIDVYRLIKKDLDKVNQCLNDVLLKNASPVERSVIEYLLAHQGKQLRPVLVFLSTYLFKSDFTPEEKNQLILAATAIETIHLASLVHDDVIDEADVRRDAKTLRSKFGNQVAVTMGVYLYSVALELIAKLGSISILAELSATVKIMCQGELLQNDLRLNQNYKQDQYYQVIKSKTAVLFKSACVLGTLLFNQSKQVTDDVSQYAMQLGYAYQLADDFLDIFGKNSDLNKTVGQDFYQGQLTLPMIYVVEQMTAAEKDLFWRCINLKDNQGLVLLNKKIKETTVGDTLKSIIDQRLTTAKLALDSFEHNRYYKSLVFLADYVAKRVK